MRQQLPLFTTLLLSVLLISSGCRTEPRVAQASQDLATKISQEEKSQAVEPNAGAHAEESRLYLDASLSMAGFVDSRNHTQFDDVIDSIGDYMPGCLLFKYGQAGQNPQQDPAQLMTPARFGSEIHSSGFYDRTYNPDDRLIEALAAEERPVRSVLLTDGVYSQVEGSTSPPVVNAIQKWMQRGRSLGIFIFRSRFNGRFYSEIQRGMLREQVTVEDRPFYAFVFSPTMQGVKELQERLQPRFRDMRAIIFSPDAINTEINWTSRPKETYQSARPPSKSYYWQMFNEDLFAQRGQPALAYTLKPVLLPEYPVAALKVDTAADYYRWERTGFKKVEDGAPAGFNFNAEPEQQAAEGASQPDNPAEVRLSAKLQPDRSSDFGFYHLKMNLGVKDLRPDILALSTRDDRAPKDANRTYRFYEFMHALTNMHFKTQLAAKTSRSLFVTVKNH
jgi:hypothetical protein